MANREVQWFPVYAIDAQNYLRGVRNYQVAVYLEDGSLAPFVYNEKGQQVSNPFSATIPGTYIGADPGTYEIVFSTSGGVEFRRQKVLFLDNSAVELLREIGFFPYLIGNDSSFVESYKHYPIKVGYVVRVNAVDASSDVIPSDWRCTSDNAPLPGGATPGELYEGKLYVDNGDDGYFVFEYVGEGSVDVDTGEVSTLRNELASGDESKGSWMIGVKLAAAGAFLRRLFDWIMERPQSVTNFGVKGDGTNEIEKIQKALDSGLNIFFPKPPVFYGIDGELELTADHQKIYSLFKAEIRQLSNEATNILLVENKIGCAIRGLHLHQNGIKDTSARGNGILVRDSEEICIEDNLITNHRGFGVQLRNSNYCNVHRNRFKEAPSDIANTSDGSSDIGVIYSSSYNWVTKNICESGNVHGINVQSIAEGDSTNHNKINYNIIRNAGHYGIQVYATSVDTLTGNNANGNEVIGNTIVNTTGAIPNIGNGLENYYCGGAGIYIQNVDDITVSLNDIDGTHTAEVPEGWTRSEIFAPGAIGCLNQTAGVITSNKIRNAGYAGIWVADANAGGIEGQMVVAANMIRNAVREGIYAVRRGNLSIANNVIQKARQLIRVNNDSTAKRNVSITGNIGRDATQSNGILVTYVDGLLVDGNNVDQVEGSGIDIGNCTDATVTANTVRNFKVRGIDFKDSNSGGFIDDNTIKGNGTSLIGLKVEAACRLGDNRISGCATLMTGANAHWRTLTVNSGTPSVKDGKYFITHNTAPTTITDFLDGHPGQEIVIIFRDDNGAGTFNLTTLDFTGTTLKGNGGVDRLMKFGDAIRAVYNNVNNQWIVDVIATTA